MYANCRFLLINSAGFPSQQVYIEWMRLIITLLIVIMRPAAWLAIALQQVDAHSTLSWQEWEYWIETQFIGFPNQISLWLVHMLLCKCCNFRGHTSNASRWLYYCTREKNLKYSNIINLVKGCHKITWDELKLCLFQLNLFVR